MMVTDDMLQLVQQQIRDSIETGSTPAAARMRDAVAALGPITVSVLTPDLIDDCARLIQDCFADEPLGMSCGRTVETAEGDKARKRAFIQLAANKQEADGKKTSVVVKAGSHVIAATITYARSNNFKPFEHDESIELSVDKRVHSMFLLLDSKAVVELDKQSLPHDNALEIVFGVTRLDFRGSLEGPAFDCDAAADGGGGVLKGGFGFSIYQRLSFLVEALALKHGYTAVYSHSHDISAARRAGCGWNEIVSIAFSDLPKNIAVTPVSGRSQKFMYKRLKDV